MVKSCFCPGCKTGYLSDRKANKRNGTKTASLFRPPKDPVLFELWKKVIPRADRTLSCRDFVCEKHFKEEDIKREYEPLKLFDGTIWRYKKDRPSLKPGAVPCIFSNVPGHSSYAKKRFSARKGKKKRKKVNTEQITGNEATQCEDLLLSSKEKENIIETELNLLPSIIEKCITADPQVVFASFIKTESLTEEPQVHFSQSALQHNLSRQPQVILSESDLRNNFSSEHQTIPSHSDHRNNLSTETQVIISQSDKRNSVSTEPQVIIPQSDLRNNLCAKPRVIIPKSDLRNNLSAKPQAIIPQADIRNNSSTNPQVIIPQSDFRNNLSTELKGTVSQSDQRNNVSAESHRILPCSDFSDNLAAEPEIIFPQSVIDEQFSFNFLKVNINMIEKVNSWWTINVFDDFIICARWNSDCAVERKIVIYKDLSVKVFLKEKETAIGNDLKVISIETISKLIYRVERTTICKGIDNEEATCLGFLQSKFMCKRKSICLNCIKWEKEKAKEEKRQLREERKLAQKHIELLRFHFTA